ncbi:hypothetical protein D3Z41_18735 [Parabacteroides distasonis]|nr:hypothetical protein [Parabacteroides distasonis]
MCKRGDRAFQDKTQPLHTQLLLIGVQKIIQHDTFKSLLFYPLLMPGLYRAINNSMLPFPPLIRKSEACVQVADGRIYVEIIGSWLFN